jgi:hypothetical protein
MTEEIWRERRLPRSGFGQLAKWLFVGFNLWVVFEVVRLIVIMDGLKADAGGQGMKILGINLVQQNKLIEWFAIWLAGVVVLGGATLATRGRREMVRVVETAPK